MSYLRLVLGVCLNLVKGSTNTLPAAARCWLCLSPSNDVNAELVTVAMQAPSCRGQRS